VSKPPHILFSCGEASGDLYVSQLLAEMSRREPDVTSFGLGGQRCAAAGGDIVVPLDEVSVIGLVEVVSKLPALRRAMSRLCHAAEQRRPDAAVLVDFSGFNLRLAKRLASLGIPILYYVSPQVWAWRRGRVRTIREVVDEMLVILPFEEAFYREQGIDVRYVGHPLVDLVRAERDRETLCRDLGLDATRPIVAVLPGSRSSEIERHMPTLRDAMAELTRRRPELQFLVSRAPTIAAPSLAAALGERDPSVHIVDDGIYDVLTHADAGIIASGTATVEAAIAGTPMIVVYRVGRASYFLGKPFVNLPHYSMVNLIAGRRLVPELIQDAFTVDAVVSEVMRLLDDTSYRDEMVSGLRDVRAKLGSGGASGRAAEAVLSFSRRMIRDGAPVELS
jgi:lipid-A-disaccharide synthase